jgi:predicted RNase H-like HicB family nuclease
MSEYRVLYRRAKDGSWVASVRGLRCRGRGRTIREARADLRQALAAVADNHQIDLVEDVRLPPPGRRLLVEHWTARRRAQLARERSDEAARRACQALLENGITLRDASDLLGIPVARLGSATSLSGVRPRRGRPRRSLSPA